MASEQAIGAALLSCAVCHHEPTGVRCWKTKTGFIICDPCYRRARTEQQLIINAAKDALADRVDSGIDRRADDQFNNPLRDANDLDYL